MRKLIIRFSAILAFMVVIVLSGAQASAVAPGCYTTEATGQKPVDCNALKVLFPDVPIDPALCYKTLPGPTYAPPQAFTCTGSAIAGAVTNNGSGNGGSAVGSAVVNGGVPAASDTITVDSNNTYSADDLKKCDGSDAAKLQACLKKNPLVNTLNAVINFIGVGVGVIVVIMVIIGGIQYITAGSNPQAVSAAKKRIFNAILALVAYVLLFSFMQWLLPGGLF
jgi:hypothetical protein